MSPGRWVVAAVVAAAGCQASASETPAPDGPRWLAGDHHIHSRFSVGWDTRVDPPAPVVGADGIYPIPMNAVMAKHFGLSWMVATDHGGPNHSKVSLEQTYPEMLMSREVVPEVIQFFGMEFDTPGADHSSIILPHTHDEADRLHEIESSFSKQEPWPRDPSWDTEPRMIEALGVMRGFPRPPLLMAHHPSRSATATGVYGLTGPAELRAWNDAAPEVAVGMEGAPGHQGVAIEPDGSLNPRGARGAYGNAPTLGGFDQMTAIVGGFWDSMLGEGRHWWVTANSDSHVNWREGGADFWPGEYSKTYVWADKDHDSILESIRAGRVFVTLGDLISELHVTATVAGGGSASIGGTLDVPSGAAVEISVRWLDPETPNAHGDNPTVRRVDIIRGDITGPVADAATDTNPTTHVAARFGPGAWDRDGAYRTVTFTIDGLTSSGYIRVRGTNGAEEEPEPDPRGEDPWSDLWFYANPIFLHVR